MICGAQGHSADFLKDLYLNLASQTTTGLLGLIFVEWASVLFMQI